MRLVSAAMLVLLAAATAVACNGDEDAKVKLSDERREARMDDYKIRPGSGIGPVEIGMSRDDAKRAMETTGHTVESFVLQPNTPPVLSMQGNSFQVSFGRAAHVEEIEVMGPSSDGQSLGDEPKFAALYGDVDVFRTPASELVDVVLRDAAPRVEEHGAAFRFPTIGITLWREAVEDTPFFETVLVSRPKPS